MSKADIGLIGLAVMGENLVLNMESHGFRVAVFNRTTSKVDAFMDARAKGKNIVGCHSIEELVAKADEKKLGVLVLTDHDQVVMEYGLFPLRHLVKKREEKKSVLRIGCAGIGPVRHTDLSRLTTGHTPCCPAVLDNRAGT